MCVFDGKTVFLQIFAQPAFSCLCWLSKIPMLIWDFGATQFLLISLYVFKNTRKRLPHTLVNMVGLLINLYAAVLIILIPCDNLKRFHDRKLPCHNCPQILIIFLGKIARFFHFLYFLFHAHYLIGMNFT